MSVYVTVGVRVFNVLQCVAVYVAVYVAVCVAVCVAVFFCVFELQGCHEVSHLWQVCVAVCV